LSKFLIKLLLFSGIFLLLDYGIALILEKGLDRTYGLDRPAQVLAVGHSHTQSGLDREMLERGLGVPVSMYATGGANTFDRLAMIQHYFSKHAGSVRTVVYDVDYTTFNSGGISSNSYRLFYPYMGNSAMDRYVSKNAGSTSEYTSRRFIRSLRYDNHTLNQSLRGLIGFHSNYKTGKLDVVALRQRLARDKHDAIRVDRENVKYFEETVRFVRSQNARLVLLYIPTIDIMNNLDRVGHQRIIGMFKSYAAADPGVIFLDYNEKYERRHELFRDPTHLNRAGQEIVSNDLIRDLQ